MQFFVALGEAKTATLCHTNTPGYSQLMMHGIISETMVFVCLGGLLWLTVKEFDFSRGLMCNIIACCQHHHCKFSVDGVWEEICFRFRQWKIRSEVGYPLCQIRTLGLFCVQSFLINKQCIQTSVEEGELNNFHLKKDNITDVLSIVCTIVSTSDPAKGKLLE